MSRGLALGFVAAAAAAVGCTGAGGGGLLQRERALGGPLETDIVRVLTYKGNNPFVSLDPAGDPNPEGVRFAYYAISARTNKGAHADGIIRIKMYAIHHPPDAAPYGELIRQHELTPDDARPYRVTRFIKHLGWPYQFDLDWGDADVFGHEVRVVPEFVRRDGRVISGTPWSVKVPARRAQLRLTG